MKNLSYVIVALAVVLGFGSCKKENMLEVNEMRVFSVSADATDGTKAIVTPQGVSNFMILITYISHIKVSIIIVG